MGQHHSMQDPHTYENYLLTLVSVVLYVIAQITLSDFALFATIFAATSTGVLNIYRWWKERKKP